MRTTWKSSLCSIIALTLVGVVTSVGVSWTLAVLDQREEDRLVRQTRNLAALMRAVDAPTQAWPVSVSSDWPKSPQRVVVDVSRYCSTAHAQGQDPAAGFAGRMYAERYGWPALCLALVSQEFQTRGRPISRAPGSRIQLPIKTPSSNTIDLPVRPLWPGFALNTLIYAALAWSLWQVPLTIRRTRRRRAGKCVRCGYDLKGLAAGSTCPECGA